LRRLALFALVSALVFAENPRHQFTSSKEPLTQPSNLPARTIAQEHLRSVASTIGLGETGLAGVYLRNEYTTDHNGVTHLRYGQQFYGIEVYSAAWSVNIDSQGRVLNAGGFLSPSRPSAFSNPSADAGARALRAVLKDVNPSLATSYLPMEREANLRTKTIRFSRGGFGDVIEGKPVWYPVSGRLIPAWTFYVQAEDGVMRYESVVDPETDAVLVKAPMTYFQSRPPARGMVFVGPSPQPPATFGAPTTDRPYVERQMRSFDGDPAASPRGWVDDTATIGNNVRAGFNPLGISLLATSDLTIAADRNFTYPLQLGPGFPAPSEFRDAATANLFYWSNVAHDEFYKIGFNEAAGNYQRDNFHKGGVEGDAMLAASHYGIQQRGAVAPTNNAFYTTTRPEDGQPSGIHMYISQNLDSRTLTDSSYDNEVIIHEYTHGVSTRLVPNLSFIQGRAMGEAWSDFYGLEFTVPEGADPDGVYPFGEYFLQLFGTGIRNRPYTTNMEINPITFAQLGRVFAQGPQVHSDGEIWMSALWQMRANLIRQFGEREGRRRARILVLDGMKLSLPNPTMVDARDAILLADRVNYNGASQSQIWAAFAKRGLGVLAHSTDPDSPNILASFDTPSAGGKLAFYETTYLAGEAVRVVLHDDNNKASFATIQLTTSVGDVETVRLERLGETFYGLIPMSTNTVNRNNGTLNVVAPDAISAYYTDGDTGSGASQIQVTVPVTAGYTGLVGAVPTPLPAGNEAPIFAPFTTLTSVGAARISLPFDFPFFDRKYGVITVYGSGLISFLTPEQFTTACKDVSALSRLPAIAPMWTTLVYGGRAQANENVYFFRGSNFVRIRWAAETFTSFAPPLGPNPEPVNFSATLFEDGRIEFAYGAGNRAVVNNDATARSLGCAMAGPTVGISRGRDSYALTLSTHHERVNLEGALPIRFEPPFANFSIPEAFLETPAEGATVRGTLSVRGVAIDRQQLLTRGDLLIDGVSRGTVALNQPRPEVCAQAPVPGCPNIGFFRADSVEALGLTPGTHTIQLQFTNARGGFVRVPETPRSFVVEAGQPASRAGGNIDAPTAGATVRGIFQVTGWAHAGELRVAGVDVLIDGITYATASYGLSRNDVCNAILPRPVNCPNVGFVANINSLRGAIVLPDGEHKMQIRVRDESGRLTLLPEQPVTFTVDNGPNQLPVGAIETLTNGQTVRGVITIRGWAYDPDGTISLVRVLSNGAFVSTARYGIARPDICATLPDVTACPAIGFELEYDTRLMPNGPGRLGVILTDNRGTNVIVPNLVDGGLNVVVDNQ
jgi:extracellular elastinolytic metalloproteinase